MRNNVGITLAKVAAGLVVAVVFILVPPATAQSNPVPLVNDPLVPTTAAPGGPGFTLTVNGTGFVPSSVVNWNGSSRATNYVRGTQLTASIPASDIAVAATASITVINAAPLAVSNTVFFTVTNPNISTSLMPPNWVGSYTATAMVVGDFNGDGKLDSATLDGLGRLSVILGNGDGTFQGPAMYTIAAPIGLATGDFNGDGKLDIAVLTSAPSGFPGSVAIFLGNGDGTFQQPLSSQTDYEPISIVASDFNGDGKLDIAFTGFASFVGGAPANPTIAVLLGNGDGTFQPYVELPADYGALGGPLVAGDFNGDGFVDLVAQSASATSNVALMLLGNGDGTFQPPQASTTGYQPLVFAAADLNGDGKLDLVVPNLCGNVFDCNDGQNSPSSVSVLLGNGDGTFQPHVEYPVGIFATSIAIGDLNGDGMLDLAVGTECGGDPFCEDFGIDALSVLLGNGDGTFQAQMMPALLGEFNGIQSLAIGDFNGDGLLDPIIGGGVVRVALQSTLSVPTQPVIFGSQDMGTNSPPQMATLTNISTKVPLTFSNTQVTGPNASDFSVKTNCAKLQPKSACKVNVVFTPTGSGTRTATVVVTDSAVGSPHQIQVTGTATAPAVNLSSTSLTFHTQLVNTASPSLAVTVTNTGNGALIFSSIGVSGDFAETGNCGQRLQPAASCQILVSFRPTTAGPRSGTLTITNNAPGNPQTVSLSGYGTFFKVSASALNFGNQAVGTTSNPQTVYLANVSPKNAESVSFKIGGVNAADFKQSNNCGTALAAHSTCAISVTFTPGAAGNRTAVLEIIGGGGSPRTVNLIGNGD